ncbi:hypothetical protein GCM10010344_05180 [Streptomyces bluensis]|nr:hypothetical protein GCM10010344_05180 [Streptomyces bluensis]
MAEDDAPRFLVEATVPQGVLSERRKAGLVEEATKTVPQVMPSTRSTSRMCPLPLSRPRRARHGPRPAAGFTATGGQRRRTGIEVGRSSALEPTWSVNSPGS